MSAREPGQGLQYNIRHTHSPRLHGTARAVPGRDASYDDDRTWRPARS
ncbi:hypothetical protein ACGH7X_39695 [Streptomyces sp. BBFR51]